MASNSLLRSPYWVVGRRVALVAIVVVLAYRNYGDGLLGRLSGPDPVADIVITQHEFKSDPGGERPLWILELENRSTRTAYDTVTMEATYFDAEGGVLETDRIVIGQRLNPGDVQTIASPDPKPRTGSVDGTLRVIDGEVVEQ